jgi:hypothetical protein
MKSEISLRFGGLVPPIFKQLNDQGIEATEAECETMQRWADAILLLRLHGLLPEGQARCANKRVLKAVHKHIVGRPSHV